jgi:predicted phage terminase large subunit-like protein
MLRQDLHTFGHRAFYELNPNTPFLPNWHLELIAAEMQRAARGELKRLMVLVQPRSLKSLFASVALPAFILGHDPSAQIICVSYGQDLANKHSADCRRVMTSDWYCEAFPHTRLSPQKQSVQEFATTRNGSRLATSVGGVLTGRGADFIIIDDPLKPDEAVSETQRKAVNEWYDHTLYSRLNDKEQGVIMMVMQRLHEDDLVGHVLEQEDWHVIRLPAIAEEDESHVIRSPFRTWTAYRKAGEALHPEREPLPVLERLKNTIGSWNFSAQYQQSPSPLGGGMVKWDWFCGYDPGEQPAKFDMVFQSWDTANKSTELSDYSVCITLGRKGKRLFVLDVFRKRLDYPDLKRAVRDLAIRFRPTNILIEDKASGTQLIQELIREGVYGVTRYEPTMDKIMRMHSVTSTIENGFVLLPTEAAWLYDYYREIVAFPACKHDDQADATSQALDWAKQSYVRYPLFDYYRQQELRARLRLSDDYRFLEWDDDDEIVVVHRETGQQMRWNGHYWDNCN